jgi:hypothetical protein
MIIVVLLPVLICQCPRVHMMCLSWSYIFCDLIGNQNMLLLVCLKLLKLHDKCWLEILLIFFMHMAWEIRS